MELKDALAPTPGALGLSCEADATCSMEVWMDKISASSGAPRLTLLWVLWTLITLPFWITCVVL
jgi:hypothetical protein